MAQVETIDKNLLKNLSSQHIHEVQNPKIKKMEEGMICKKKKQTKNSQSQKELLKDLDIRRQKSAFIVTENDENNRGMTFSYQPKL